MSNISPELKEFIEREELPLHKSVSTTEKVVIEKKFKPTHKTQPNSEFNFNTNQVEKFKRRYG